MEESKNIFNATVKTGTDTWAFISGSLDFVKDQVAYCYYLARIKYPESPTYIGGDLPPEAVVAIKRKVKRMLLKNKKEEKNERKFKDMSDINSTIS